MRRTLSSLLMLLLSPLTLAGNHWTTELPGGGMRFQGLIIAEACKVETSDIQMTVNMGQVRSNAFHSTGEDVNPVAFDIHLQDCDAAVSQRIGVAFYGVPDNRNPDILSIGKGPGSADGLGIALFDTNGNLIPLNTPASGTVRIYDGPTTLHFVAKYRSTAQRVTGGVANAQAWFSLTYL